MNHNSYFTIDKEDLYEENRNYRLLFSFQFLILSVRNGERVTLTGSIFDATSVVEEDFYSEIVDPYFVNTHSLIKFKITYKERQEENPCTDFQFKKIEYSNRGKEIIMRIFFDERELLQCIQQLEIFQ